MHHREKTHLFFKYGQLHNCFAFDSPHLHVLCMHCILFTFTACKCKCIYVYFHYLKIYKNVVRKHHILSLRDDLKIAQ